MLFEFLNVLLLLIQSELSTHLTQPFTKYDHEQQNLIQPICRPIIKMVLGNKVTFSLNLFKKYGMFGDISLNPLSSKLNMSFVGIVQISQLDLNCQAQAQVRLPLWLPLWLGSLWLSQALTL